MDDVIKDEVVLPLRRVKFRIQTLALHSCMPGPRHKHYLVKTRYLVIISTTRGVELHQIASNNIRIFQLNSSPATLTYKMIRECPAYKLGHTSITENTPSTLAHQLESMCKHTGLLEFPDTACDTKTYAFSITAFWRNG
jgi:hypothetical protein